MHLCLYFMLVQIKRVQLKKSTLYTFFPGFTMNCVVWCHAHLLHIAISIIDDHYSFSLKSVREKLLQMPRKQQQIWCDDATRNRKKLSFFFFMWNGVKHQHLLKKNIQHSLLFSLSVWKRDCKLSRSESSMESNLFEDLLGLVWK